MGRQRHREVRLRFANRAMGPGLSSAWGRRSTALEREVVERTLEHPNNPALNWNIANAVVRMDPAGNRKIDKDKARFRIDGAVALAMLCGLKSKDRKAVVDMAGMIDELIWLKVTSETKRYIDQRAAKSVTRLNCWKISR